MGEAPLAPEAPPSPARLPVALNPPWGASCRVSSATEETVRKLDVGAKVPLWERKREEEEGLESEPTRRRPMWVLAQPEPLAGSGSARQDRGPSPRVPRPRPGVFRPQISPTSPLGTGGAGGIQAACGLEHRNSQMISGCCSPRQLLHRVQLSEGFWGGFQEGIRVRPTPTRRSRCGLGVCVFKKLVCPVSGLGGGGLMPLLAPSTWTPNTPA